MGGLKSRFTRVGALRVHARVGGLDSPGGPIVLLHGIGVSSRYFVPLGLRLAPAHPVLAVDLPGFGRSDKPAEPLDIPGLGRALEAWLGAVGLERPALVANSMGCQVAVDLAARSPGRLGPLVLTAPTVDPHERSATRQLERLLEDSKREPRSLLPIILADYARFGLVRFFWTAEFTLRDRIEDKLPHVAQRTLVISGERDALVPPSWAREAAALLPRGRVEVLPGEAHACHYSAPGRVAELVRSFLEEGEEGGGERLGRVEHGRVPGAGEDDEADVG